MKKMLIIFLSITLCIGSLTAQSIDGNYNIDSLVVKYVMVTRDMNQEVDGVTYVSASDAAQSNYGLRVRFPSAADDAMKWEFELPFFAPGDTIRVTDVALPTAAHLAAGNISMDVDFVDGIYEFLEGSTYPTTQTVDCVTGPVNPGITDRGTWTDGDYGEDGAVVGVDANGNPISVLTGWGIITSGIFASFQAPNMATMTKGVDYGIKPDGSDTDLPNWGYMKTTYANGFTAAATGLNLGWEAHDGKSAGIGIVSTGDQYFDQAEADLGLLNGVVGIGSLPIDSVTIASMSALAGSGATITMPAPTATDPTATVTYPNDAAAIGMTVSYPDNKAYMFNGPGQRDATGAIVMDDSVNTTTGQTVSWPQGQFNGTKAYIFDPTGDLLGGGDKLPFSGDEGLKFTGYYATWNTLQTLLAMKEGATNAITAAVMATTPPNPNALPTAEELITAIIDAVIWQWDLVSLPDALVAGTVTQITAQFNTELTAILTEAGTATPTVALMTQAINNLMPYILGGMTGIEYGDYAALFVDSDGDAMSVDDSDWDVDPDSWYWWGDSTVSDTVDGVITVTDLPYINADGSINGTYYEGGRLFVELDANCIPAKWSQYIDSHWAYSGETTTMSAEDEGIVVETFEIKGNYPNPFNPITKIRFTNDRTANVKVNVYSLLGEKVNTLMNKQLNSGLYDITWNGLNSQGKIVPSGMYIYEIVSDGRRLKGKMLFLK